MGGGSSKPADKYVFSMHGEGGIASSPSKVVPLPVTSVVAPYKEEKEVSPPDKRQIARNRLIKAKNVIVSANAFAQMGASRAARCKIKMSPICPWLVREYENSVSLSAATFETARIIGRGVMGTVRVSKWKNENMYCAIKSIKKKYVCKHNNGRHVQNERDLLKSINHPFIIHLFGTFQDPEHIYFVLEYAAGGELFSRLEKKQCFSGDCTKFYAVEILLAIEFLHSNNIIYRDLKPENVLLDDEGHVKLCDLGFARRFSSEDERCRTNVGTPAYLSPEQLNKHFTGGYNKIVDWWSFGCVVYEMLVGQPPFCNEDKESHYAIYLRVLAGRISYPRHFPASAKALVSSLLHADVTQRLVDPALIKAQEFLTCDFRAVYNRLVVPPFVPKLQEPGDAHYFYEYSDHDTPEKNPLHGIDESVFEGF